MKAILYIIGTIATLFILVLILAANSKPSYDGSFSKPKTLYQECKEGASHMRSDRETEDVMRNMCDRLPVENADLR